MASCFKCRKPVYFAERTVALCKEWHKACFNCYECGKVLHPGRHSEHKGLPYCEVPCYLALFGPQGYRQGVGLCQRQTSDSVVEKVVTLHLKDEMEAKLAAYNEYYSDNSKLHIKKTQTDGMVVLEGLLRVYWGIERPIRFKQKDDMQVAEKSRHSEYCFKVSNGDDEGLIVSPNAETMSPVFQPSLIDIMPDVANDPDVANERCHENGNGETNVGAVVMRRRVKRQRNTKRLSIINGHLYDAETSIFVPSYGSVTNVVVTDRHTCPQVIKALLDKFKVENCPDEYCLSVVKYDGATRALSSSISPLLERLELGPREDESKVFIIERRQALNITQEVAQFYNLPEAVLHGFLEKMVREEEHEIEWIKERHKYRRMALEQRLAELNSELARA